MRTMAAELKAARGEVERLIAEHRKAARERGKAEHARAVAREGYDHAGELQAQGDIDRLTAKLNRLETARKEAQEEVERLERRIANARDYVAQDHGDRDPSRWGDVAATVGKVMPSITRALPPFSDVQTAARRIEAWAREVETTARRLEAVKAELAEIDGRTP